MKLCVWRDITGKYRYQHQRDATVQKPYDGEEGELQRDTETMPSNYRADISLLKVCERARV